MSREVAQSQEERGRPREWGYMLSGSRDAAKNSILQTSRVHSLDMEGDPEAWLSVSVSIRSWRNSTMDKAHCILEIATEHFWVWLKTILQPRDKT